MNILINFLLAIHVIISLLIILIVLMQRPKNEGLGAAFGGGMTENLFGAQTTNVLQTITRYLGGMFFALTLLLSWLYVQKAAKGGGSALQQRLSAETVIPAAPTPAPALPELSTPPAPTGGLELSAATPGPLLDQAPAATPTPALAPPTPVAATPPPVAATPRPVAATPRPAAATPKAVEPPAAVVPAATPKPFSIPATKGDSTPRARDRAGNRD